MHHGYIQLEAIKVTNFGHQGRNASHSDAGADHFFRHIFRTDDLDVAHLEHGRMEQ